MEKRTFVQEWNILQYFNFNFIFLCLLVCWTKKVYLLKNALGMIF